MAIAVALTVVTLGIYLPSTLLAPLAPVPAHPVTLVDPGRAAAAVSLPTFGASAVGALGYPTVLAKAGSDKPLPIASISKIVTSLVVLGAKPLILGQSGPTITFTASDAALTAKYIALNGETKPLRAGMKISQLDLMRVTLVASANNYADALAQWAFGSPAAFRTAAALWLNAHGLSQTTIVEPTGINPANSSTATDLVQIGKLALANPVLASIVATPSMSLAGVGSFDNTNTLLGRNGVQGIKTGTLNGESDLLFAAKYAYGAHTITVIGAVIGAVDHAAADAAVTTILDGVKAGFHEVTLATRGQVFASLTTAWSQSAKAVATAPASVVVWGNSPLRTIVSVRPVRVGVGAARVGEVAFTVGNQTAVVPLVLDHRLIDPGPWWRLTHPAIAVG